MFSSVLLIEIKKEIPMGPGVLEAYCAQFSIELFTIDNFSDALAISYAKRMITESRPLVVFSFEHEEIGISNLRAVFNGLLAESKSLTILSNLEIKQLQVLAHKHEVIIEESNSQLKKKIEELVDLK